MAAVNIRIAYCQNAVIFTVGESCDRVFLRTGGAGQSGTTIVDSYPGSSWYYGSASMSSNTTYTANVKTKGQAEFSSENAFTFTSTSGLKDRADSIGMTVSGNSITVKMSGWGVANRSYSGTPNISIYLYNENNTSDKTTTKTLSLEKWMSSGYTFTGLTWEATYRAYVKIADPDLFMTNTPIATIGTAPRPSISSFKAVQTAKGTGSIKCTYSATNVSDYDIYYRVSGGTWQMVDDVGTTSYTITGLTIGYTYEVYLLCYGYSLNSTESTHITLTLAAKDPPSITLNSVTQPTIGVGTVNLSYTVSNASGATYTAYYIQTGGSSWSSKTSSSSTTCQITGLTVGVEYKFYVHVENDDGQARDSNTITKTIGSNRPSDWAWTNVHSAGSKCTTLTATEWNSFMSRINEFRVYKGLSNYSFTTVSKGDTFTADIFNAAKTAISEISGHGDMPTSATAGGTVYWTRIDALRTALNAVS